MLWSILLHPHFLIAERVEAGEMAILVCDGLREQPNYSTGEMFPLSLPHY